MQLRMTRAQFEQAPIQGYLVGGQNADILYDVSDDFIRDLNIFLNDNPQSNYTTLLIKLIFKADHNNLIKLSKIYPTECLTIWAYKNISDFDKQIIK